MYSSYLPNWYTTDVKYYNSSDHSAAGTHEWCGSLKLTVTNNIQVLDFKLSLCSEYCV